MRQLGLLTFKKCLIAIMFVCWSTSYADAPLFKVDAPKQYQVKPGDTLYGIAKLFLTDPSRWAEASTFGQDDANRLYPGDVLLLTSNESGAQIEVQPAKEANEGRGTTVKLSPRIRVSEATKAIPTIPYSEIKPFVNQSRVVDKSVLENAKEVTAIDEYHILVSEGNKFYAEGLCAKPGQSYLIFRDSKDYIHPVSKEVLGTEAVLLGRAVVTAAGDISTLVLKESIEEVRIGDKLLLPQEEQIDPYVFPKRPNIDNRGYILSVFGGIGEVGQYQVVAITGGKDCKRENGDVLVIYQTQKNTPLSVATERQFRQKMEDMKPFEYPYQPIGRALVFKTFDKVSFALILDSLRSIQLLDEVWTQ